MYAELAALAGIQEMSTADVKDAAMEKLNPFQRFCRMLSNIFVPIIPAIVAAFLTTSSLSLR